MLATHPRPRTRQFRPRHIRRTLATLATLATLPRRTGQNYPAAIALTAVLLAVTPASAQSPPAGFRFPTVPAAHPHARELLANALRYLDPANKLSDPVSGYPFEGWNQDPGRKLYLRSFTQLTAIGLWMEALADVAAGQADVPFLSRDQALGRLTL